MKISARSDIFTNIPHFIFIKEDIGDSTAYVPFLTVFHTFHNLLKINNSVMIEPKSLDFI